MLRHIEAARSDSEHETAGDLVVFESLVRLCGLRQR
jgi:hypothetical protein